VQPEETVFPWRDPPAERIESLTQMGMTPLDSEITYSRVVRATVGQILEIPFRGNGWIYLGELASRRGIVYNSRRNDPEGQSFIFTLEEAGIFVLKFYRQDFIRDYILNDHVQVIVGQALSQGSGWFNPALDRSRVIAHPRWPSALDEAGLRSPRRSPDAEPVITTAEPAALPLPPVSIIPPALPENENIAAVFPQDEIPDTVTRIIERLAPEVILQRAQSAFDGGNVASAIALLDQYIEFYPDGCDEVLWLLGQFYEANSPSRNILLSLSYYRRLINEYPQSVRFNDARRRIAYLERFFINIH